MGADLEALISRYVDPRVAARVAAMDNAVVFVNFRGQAPAISRVRAKAPPIAGVNIDNTFLARHFLYNVPQSVAWREPPLLTQLSVLRDWRVAVNPHRHFVRPSLADLAAYMWEVDRNCPGGASGADINDPGGVDRNCPGGAGGANVSVETQGTPVTSLDVFVGSPTALDSAFLFELTAPLTVVTAVVLEVAWRAVEPGTNQPFTRPVVYENTITVAALEAEGGSGGKAEDESEAEGEGEAKDSEEWKLKDLAHTTIVNSGIGPGAVVRLVVDADAALPEPALLDVVRPVETVLPCDFRWVNSRCCLTEDMEAAMEMRHCCRRLGLPESVSLQAFYSLESRQLVRALHSQVIWGDAPVSPSLADIMHCSSAFAPEWGQLRLHLLVHACGVDDFGGLMSEHCALSPGDRLFLRQRWAAFEAFLTRHGMWSAATAFAVVPLPEDRRKRGKTSKKSQRRRRRRGVSIRGRLSETITHLSAKPHPSPPEELATAP